MTSIFVFNNPGNIQYDVHLLTFVRSWHLPWKEGDAPMEDSWLRVPALRITNARNVKTYNCINSNLELLAPMILAEEDCVVYKTGKVRPYKPIPVGLIQAVRFEAIDVPEWEQNNQKAWPFNDMFLSDLVRYRYDKLYGSTEGLTMAAATTSRTYSMIKKIAMPRPCRSCGGKNRRR